MTGKVKEITTHLKDQTERKAAEQLVDHLLNRLDIDGNLSDEERAKQRTKTYLELLDLSRHFYKGALTEDKYFAVRRYLSDPDNRWVKFINDILDKTDPGYAKKAILSLGFEAFFRGTKDIRANRDIYHCNIPWLILFDPTMACNMHCIGCWSGTYGHKDNLTYEEMDRIVTQGKALGTHLYMLTGGEPLVRKKDIVRLCEKHSDCFFAAYTNSTLIDEELCQDVLRVGNLLFMLSIEGTPETNDARRGDGHYAAVMKAMDLLNSHGIPFGISVCYTSQNIDAVTSDDFFRFVADKGARFGFYFHYMPVGNNAVPSLMPTVEQRKKMIERIRFVRSVRDKSILEILQSPLFMAYHKGQPFNRNHLRPCPMLENPEMLRKIVKETGAKQTNLESEETVEHLCGKCDDYAKEWAPVADKIWDSQPHKVPSYENYAPEKKIGNVS